MGNTYANVIGTSAEERERLILEHLPQVRLISRRIHERLPETVSLDDLISTGILGLISAIDNFDPSQNVKLRTYAEYKIRGAILDSLRHLDWAPRQTRKQCKQIEAAISKLEQRLQRMPTEEEICAELGISVDEYREWLLDARSVTIGSLDHNTFEDNGRELIDYIPDPEGDSPAQQLERKELEALLAQAIERIPEIERTVLSLYYQEELTLREIAQVVGLHESRISQLKTQAILRLRTYMSKRWPNPRGI